MAAASLSPHPQVLAAAIMGCDTSGGGVFGMGPVKTMEFLAANPDVCTPHEVGIPIALLPGLFKL